MQLGFDQEELDGIRTKRMSSTDDQPYKLPWRGEENEGGRGVLRLTEFPYAHQRYCQCGSLTKMKCDYKRKCK